MPLLIAQPRNAVGGEAVRLLHVGKMSVEGPGAGGGCTASISSHWGQLEAEICVCIYFSLKKGKRTPELIICKSWMRNLEAAGPCIFKSS